MKCPWCHKDCSGRFCDGECEKRYADYENRCGRYGKWFLLGIFLPLLLTIPAIVSDAPDRWIGLMLAVEGAVFITLPFATPETVSLLGARSSVLLTRVAGLFFLVLGMVLALRSF